jgi:hypothetical protein
MREIIPKFKCEWKKMDLFLLVKVKRIRRESLKKKRELLDEQGMNGEEKRRNMKNIRWKLQGVYKENPGCSTLRKKR